MNKALSALGSLFLCLIILGSCGKDDEFQPEGKWILSAIEASDCADAEFDNVIFNKTSSGLCFEEDGQSVCIDVCLTFKSDGTVDFRTTFFIDAGGFMLGDSDDISGTWTLDGDLLTVCDDMDCETINISESENQIVLSDFDDDLECSVSLTLEKE